MGHILTILTLVIALICLGAYLKVIYECVRRVRVVKVKNNLKKSSRKQKGVANQSLEAAKHIETQDESIKIEVFKQAPGPLPWPILGNLSQLGCDEVPFQTFSKLAKQYGDIYSLTLGTTRCLIVNSLDLIREVLNQNGKFFGGRPDFKRFDVLFGGNRNNSLALCNWSQLQQKRRNLARKHCSPRDTNPIFQKMSDVGCAEVQELMQHLEKTLIEGDEYKVKPIIQQTCANMFSKYMCSVRFDYDDEEFQNIVRCFDEIFWEINQGYAVDFLPWLYPFYVSHMKKIQNWARAVRKFILERVINDRENCIDLDEPEKDFTDALLKSLAQDKDVSRDTIIFMLEDFIGGHSAIGNLVMLALAYIVRNPEVAKRIQEEVDGVIGDTNRIITLRDMDDMVYTVATIYEVLRYTSSPIVPHVATEDVTIAGFGVTKNTVVFINNYELNTSARYWDQPEKFNPERFIERTSASTQAAQNNGGNSTPVSHVGQLKKNIPHFLPFSIGKRTCIGQNLVKGFGFILLANIMHKYEVSCRDISQIVTYPACVAVPPDTFSLIFTTRKAKSQKQRHFIT